MAASRMRPSVLVHSALGGSGEEDTAPGKEIGKAEPSAWDALIHAETNADADVHSHHDDEDIAAAGEGGHEKKPHSKASVSGPEYFKDRLQRPPAHGDSGSSTSRGTAGSAELEGTQTPTVGSGLGPQPSMLPGGETHHLEPDAAARGAQSTPSDSDFPAHQVGMGAPGATNITETPHRPTEAHPDREFETSESEEQQGAHDRRGPESHPSDRESESNRTPAATALGLESDEEPSSEPRGPDALQHMQQRGPESEEHDRRGEQGEAQQMLRDDLTDERDERLADQFIASAEEDQGQPEQESLSPGSLSPEASGGSQRGEQAATHPDPGSGRDVQAGTGSRDASLQTSEKGRFGSSESESEFPVFPMDSASGTTVDLSNRPDREGGTRTDGN